MNLHEQLGGTLLKVAPAVAEPLHTLLIAIVGKIARLGNRIDVVERLLVVGHRRAVHRAPAGEDGVGPREICLLDVWRQLGLQYRKVDHAVVR